MQQVPFTPAGVSDLLSQIYALPDPQLHQEAASAAANFRLWLNSNFELTVSQQTYIQEIDNQFIAIAGADVQIFMLGRLPIILIKEPGLSSNNVSEEEDRGKLIDLGKSEKSSYNSESGFTSQQILIFTISYQQV